MNDEKCEKCGAKNSMRSEKQEVYVDAKKGTDKDLTFDFCEECGHVTNVDLS